MSRREDNGISNRKSCNSFKKEWMLQTVYTELPSSKEKEKIKIGDIYTYDDINGVICTICNNANQEGEFSTGKKWDGLDAWKLDYLKRHLSQKIHKKSIEILRNRSNRSVLNLLRETTGEKEERLEEKKRKNSKKDMVKILLDNILLAIKINSSINSVQEIHSYISKYTEIPQDWRSKNYAFEFIECIGTVIKKLIMDDVQKSNFHTLIVDETVNISVEKILIIYFKFRSNEEKKYKTAFGGILKLEACDSLTIFKSIQQFYLENNLDFQKMVMFTSDGANVMLGKKKGVASILKKEIKHLSEQHCVAHREDLGLDDAWKEIAIMNDIEILLRTIYTTFSRSSIKRKKLQPYDIIEYNVIAFKPLNEVRWLSRHFAVSALIRNYDILIEYYKEQNDPISKYCLDMMTDTKYRITLFILNDILKELSSLCKCLQKATLTTIEALDLVKAKIKKLRSQYLGNNLLER